MENEKLTVSDRVIVYMVCALILVFTGGFFLSAKRDFSENENRKLAQFPEYSFTALKEGRFTDGIKEYVTDQFPMRDEFLGIHSEALRMSGRKEIGGVYLAGDGSLINAYEEPKNIDKDITQWTKLADNLTDARVSLMLVPTAVTVNKDRLPKQAPDRLAQELYERSGGFGGPR